MSEVAKPDQKLRIEAALEILLAAAQTAKFAHHCGAAGGDTSECKGDSQLYDLNAF